MSEDSRIGGLNAGQAEWLGGPIVSMPSSALGELDSEKAVVLKDWSAQDFANIYVRFRPHLISHARKFLREESQAEEVVQDAFLYLMTALPELDSELGVLRFLKWKTKMLSLDVLRSSHTGLIVSSTPFSEDVADEAHPGDSLERADDAAIIQLALAKLNRRQREVLVATVYEEKPQRDVARQMGLSENATRQLLHRARKAFKEALVGEVSTAGMSVGQILSVAAKKNGRSFSSTAFVLAVILTVSGAVSNRELLTNSVDLAGPRIIAGSESLEFNARNFGNTGSGANVAHELDTGHTEPVAPGTLPTPQQAAQKTNNSPAKKGESKVTQTQSTSEDAGDERNILLLSSLALESAVKSTFSSLNRLTPELETESGRLGEIFLHLRHEDSLNVSLLLEHTDQNEYKIGFGGFELQSDGNSWIGVATKAEVISESPGGLSESVEHSLEVRLSSFVVGDSGSQLGGKVLSSNQFEPFELVVKVSLILDSESPIILNAELRQLSPDEST